MIPGSGHAVFAVGEGVESAPVMAWVTVDYGGDQSDLKGYVIRNGALGIADDADNFCGYVPNIDSPDYRENLNACCREAQRIRKVAH